MVSKRKLPSFRGPIAETFAAITWDEANRAEHELRRPKPRFEAARPADWSRAFKRKDIEHPGPPDRFQALIGRDLGVAYAVYFVVFSKQAGNIDLITIRFANDLLFPKTLLYGTQNNRRMGCA